MKALLIKDWKLLKGQKQFFGAVGVISLIFLMTQNNPAFVISYITVMMTVFTISTMQYDEYENGFSYLFTLPVNRKEYVIEKYVFALISSVASSSIMLAAAVVVSRFRDLEMNRDIMLTSYLSAILVAMVFMATGIPTQMKFGAEKSRIAWMAAFMSLFVIVFVGNEILKATGASLEDTISWLGGVPTEMIIAAAVIIFAALLGISIVLSIRFLEKREF